MKLIIHIGIAKTGTSAIQRFLHSNRAELINNGFLYPVSGQFPDHSHHNLAFSMSGAKYDGLENNDPKEIIKNIKGEFFESGCSNLILSSECFPVLMDYQYFREEFSEFDVSVICYIREFSAYIESWYKQWVKDSVIRYSQSFDTFFEENKNNLDFKGALSGWCDYVSENNIIVRDYDEVASKGNICKDFSEIVGVEYSSLKELDGTVNPSLGYVGTCMLREVNKFGDLKHRNAFLSACLSTKDFDQYLGKSFINESQRQELLDIYGGDFDYMKSFYSSCRI